MHRHGDSATFEGAISRRAAKPVDLTLEREIQRDVVELYERLGCIVMRTQQSFRRGSRRNPGTSGIPDLMVFPPILAGRGVLLRGVLPDGKPLRDVWPFFPATKHS